MIITIITYSIVAFFGFWGVVASIGRIWVAQDSQSRKKAALSLIEAIVMILISIASIYIRYYDILSGLTVALASMAFLIFNLFVFPKYLKLDDI